MDRRLMIVFFVLHREPTQLVYMKVAANLRRLRLYHEIIGQRSARPPLLMRSDRLRR